MSGVLVYAAVAALVWLIATIFLFVVTHDVLDRVMAVVTGMFLGVLWPISFVALVMYAAALLTGYVWEVIHDQTDG